MKLVERLQEVREEAKHERESDARYLKSVDYYTEQECKAMETLMVPGYAIRQTIKYMGALFKKTA